MGAETIEVEQTASGILITNEIAEALAGLWPDTGKDFAEADFRAVKRWLQSANQPMRKRSRAVSGESRASRGGGSEIASEAPTPKARRERTESGGSTPSRNPSRERKTGLF